MQENRNLSNLAEKFDKSAPQSTLCSKKTNTLMKIILFLFVLSLLLGVIWNQKKITALRELLHENQEKISFIQQQWVAVKTQLEEKEKSLLNRLETLTLFEQDFRQRQETVKTSENKWVQSAQVLPSQPYQGLVSLIQVAQQYLVLQKNVLFAQKALKLALAQAAQLKEINTQRFQVEIEKILKALALVQTGQQEQVIEKLFHLAGDINKLSVKQALLSEKNPPAESESKFENPWGWLKYHAVGFFKKAIIIEHEPAKHVEIFSLNPSYLTGQMQLLLLRAQWAAFQYDERAYEDYLNQAMHFLETNFAQDAKNQAVRNQLKALTLIPLSPNLPDLSHLLESAMTLERASTSPPEVMQKKSEEKPDSHPNSVKESDSMQEQKVLSS